MAEHITITVHPTPEGDDHLTVEDAMRQVLDLIELLGKAAGAQEGDGVRVVWRLVRASTNSPFSVVAESASSNPAISVGMRASQQAHAFLHGVSDFIREGSRPAWMDGSALRIAKRIFDRNTNGIGRTDLALDGRGGDLHILPPDARRGSLEVEKAFLEEKLARPDYTRTEYGSVEGRIVAAATHYTHPALVLREWLSGDRITCVLSDEVAASIGYHHNLNDVWRGRRVLMSGAVHYDAESSITKVDVDDLEAVSEELVDLNEIRSLGIADGMTPSEHMNSAGADDFG